jgi:prepilin-type processing-associated H-X9-DG protein
MKILTPTLLACLLSVSAFAKEAKPAPAVPPPPPPAAVLALREIRYDARLSDDEARFTAEIDAEATGAGESSVKLFEGDVAVLPGKLPDSLKIVREDNRYLLIAARPGQYRFRLDLVARIQRAEPWNQVAFAGPVAAIASIAAQSGGAGMDVQLLNGTLLESAKSNGVARVKGFLGADQNVALRWSRLGGITEVARKALLTVNSTISAQITPSVIKYASQFHYDVVQGNPTQLTLALPAAQSLTRLVGEQIRDWHIAATTTSNTPTGAAQVLTIEFVKPIEKSCELTLYSEQTVEGALPTASLQPPQPLDVERESGALTVFAEDTLVEIDSLAGLRQVNAPDNALTAYRFNARPFTLAVKLKHIEPVITVADRVGARLEETRLVVTHSLALGVEKAGIYAIELLPQPGFAVAEVRGDGVEDWKVSDGKVRVNFSARVLGARRIDVQLEQALKTFPDRISLAPLRVSGAAKETAQIGVGSAAGIRLKTADLSGLREIPVRALQGSAGVSPANSSQTPARPTAGEISAPGPEELLAYTAEQPDWQLALGSERLAARVVADVFNLVTIGDGIVGGSATIRYGLVNQGVQEFRVQVPANWKNVEFTGPNIRRKEVARGSADTNSVLWTIGLQDKAWGGYTLVVTYDFQFDPNAASTRGTGSTLPLGGAHALDAEHETGSVAVTTAASLQLSAQTVGDTLRRLDESELSAADRALITRAVVLAWQYTGAQYDLAVDVKRYNQERVLEAVADRTQITSVLTEAGQMLTQASFMVKNNEKQFQAFILPRNTKLWGCYVNGLPVKPEQNGSQVLVPLPRGADRDQAFAVDIMYDEAKGALAAGWSKTLELAAPRTDVPNTYAEWQLFVPASLRLSGFGGNMNVAQGTTYELLDAWQKFLAFYLDVFREMGGAILFFGLLAFLVVAFVISAARRGWNGILTVVLVAGILAVLGAMLLPALSSAKRKAVRISSANNLKQIGLAMRVWSGDNSDRLPASLDDMRNELGTDKITYDPESGQRYIYLGAGMSGSSLKPESVVCYSPIVNEHCNVLFADGSVQQMTAAQFGELSQRGLVQVVAPEQAAQQQQQMAVVGSQLGGRPITAVAGLPAITPGVHAIHIELPQTGQPFLFTKVLNVGNEPLSIRASIMPVRTFQAIQMTWQVAAFLLGLVVWGWQWSHRFGARRNSFVLTIALALILGSVCSLLIQWRALHDLLIVGFPVVTLAIIALLIWKYWPRGSQAEAVPPMLPVSPQPATPAPAALIVLMLFLALSLAHASAGDSAIRNRQSAIGNVSILSADYSGTVNDRVALLEATLQFSSVQPGQTVALFGPEVAVQQFTVKSGGAKLVRDDGNIAVRFNRKGDAAVRIKMLVKVSGDVTKRWLVFKLPAALSSQVSLVLDQPEADVDFPTAISFKRALEKEKTRVEAVIGSGDRVELVWTPRVKRAAEVAATVFCQNSSLVTLGSGVVNVRARLDYQVTQGELRQARVRLPAGQRLLRVEANGIRTWEIKNEVAPLTSALSPSDGAREKTEQQVLVVDLLKGVSPDWRLTLETEQAMDALPASVAIEVPHALDVKRETGLVALRNAEELGLSVESASDLQRVDVEEFVRTGADKTDGLFSVFRSSRPEFKLRVRTEAIQPQIEAITRNNFRVGAEQITLSATIDYTIKRAGVFSLKAALPDGYRVERVTGKNIQQWAERSDHGRVVEVTLKERTGGSYTLTIELTRTFKELPASITVAGVHPLDTVKLTGFISVSAEPGVATKTESFDGLTEIPVVSLPDYGTVGSAGGVLAFKFISPEPKAAPEWKLNVATEAIDAWVRAEILDRITVTETLASGHALIRYDIGNAPVKELRVKVPAAFRNVEITGPNIRSRERTGDVWRVELQSKTRGFYLLTVTWEQLRAQTNSVELTGVSAEGVERETGFLAISAKAPLQVTELSATDLQRVDAGDFPDWAGRNDDAAALAYRYVRPGYRLALDARRFNEADVLQALVDSAHFTTVVADDGQMMTEMSLSVRNNGRQFLEVELPPGATNWSAFVAGQPVRPSRSNGKLLLPLQPSGAENGPVSVELTYVGANSFPRGRGPVGFDSPKFDVPLKNARWELYLPPDYDYRDFRGTMTRELAAAQPSELSFSRLEYSRMEKANRESADAELKRDVTEARRQLAGGNVREANVSFSRAKGKSVGNFNYKENDADVQKLEKDLQTAAASNLINAQNDFSSRNNGLPPAALGGAAQVQQAVRYDNASAEQQWTKLQQAQEIVAAKVQPLRVNLPIRGTRHAFTQVLQTEIGKPMSIQLFAANTKAVSWPKRIGTGAGAFLVLWGVVVLVARITRRRPEAEPA